MSLTGVSGQKLEERESLWHNFVALMEGVSTSIKERGGVGGGGKAEKCGNVLLANLTGATREEKTKKL